VENIKKGRENNRYYALGYCVRRAGSTLGVQRVLCYNYVHL
jgi:hypothetical protein